MDNCSSDNPERIIQKFSFDNLYFYSESDSGIYDAMNKGIKKSKGKWLFFLGAGDKLFISNLDSIAFDNNLKIIYGKIFNKKVGKFFGYNNNLYDLLRCNLCHQSILYNKELFEKLGFYKIVYPILADYELSIQAFFKFKSDIKYLDILIAEYDGSGISSWKKDLNFNSDKNKIIIKNLFDNFSINNLFNVFLYYRRYLVNKIIIELTKNSSRILLSRTKK
jgi:hypothetical protein